MAHVVGQSRYQTTLFPESLDEVVPSDHVVRVIDAFVNGLNLAKLGFSKVVSEETGRPPYAPGDLLKLYIYGYLNLIRSSRRLAREALRNIEVMWLINRLAPAFKTIADFRKDHAEGIVAVCRAFTRFCREQSLFGGELVAIDGTKIMAVASRKKVITPKKLAQRIEAMDRKIAEYLTGMDEADQAEREEEETLVKDMAAKLTALQEQRVKLQEQAEALARDGLSQKVIGEQEARLMRTAHHGHQVAYNAQTAVDAEHKLIAAFELTNACNDQEQLHPMAQQAKEAVAADEITVVADTGYSSGEQGALCARDGITAAVPRPQTVNPHGGKYFARDAFSYDKASDSWRCPAGETLPWRRRSLANREHQYWTNACGGCALKAQCTNSKRRMITRHFYEDDREAMHRRATGDPTSMDRRRELAEHPFGTMKWLMGNPRFLVRGLKKAKTELALTVLSYNLKRVINILGVPALLARLPSPC